MYDNKHVFLDFIWKIYIVRFPLYENKAWNVSDNRRDSDFSEKKLEVEEIVSSSINREYKINLGLKILNFLSRFEESAVFVGLLAVFLTFSVATPYFLTVTNLLTVSRQIALLGIMTIGMTLVLVCGEVDLSVGSIFGLTMVTMGLLLGEGVNPWVAMVISWIVGMGCGAVNGMLSIALRVPTIIVTLGTMNVFRGITWWSTGGFPVERFPRTLFFFQLGLGKIGGVVPVPVVVMLVLVGLGIVLLSKTVFGSHVYATGSNITAAGFMGIRVNHIKLLCLVIMGLMSGISGTIGLAHMQSGDPNGGIGYELDVIASVIIGGTQLGGGAGTVLGSLLGVFIIGILRNGLVLLGIPIYTHVIVSGAIVIVAVAIGRFTKR